MTSANTAPASISTTIAPPTVPSGLRRTICTHTSKYHGRDLFAASSGGFAAAIGSLGEVSEGAIEAPSDEDEGRSPPPSLVPDTRVEEGIREVDEEVQANDHRRDDQVHGLHDRIVELAERLEEEQPDAGQAEDGLDDHRAADVERHLQADEADHRDERVLERVAQDDAALGQALRPRGPNVVLPQDVE